ncbi:glycosyltransferase family 25 protein [Rhodobacteraceae bacterium CCMM004]|nr:glycosyltransferase family 25 protein [Rhodobacteraceae bacterium CCMM004]
MNPSVEILVVSLPESAERRRRVTENLSQGGETWAFVDGCRGDAPSPLTADPARQTRAFGRPLTAAETGCFKSHMKALERFDAADAPDWLLIMEDDVWLDPDFDVAALAARLAADGIGFCRLFCREWRRATAVARLGERQILHVKSDPYGTQGYLISRAAAARFRETVTAIDRPIDDQMGRFWENGLDIFMLFPFPMVERDVASTIAGDRDTARGARRRQSAARRWTKLRDAAAKRVYLARNRR